MDTSSYRERFVQELVDTGVYAQRSAENVRSIFTQLAQYESKLGKRIEDNLTREELIELLKHSSIGSVNSFRVVKSRLYQYLQWLCKNGYADLDLTVLYRIRYDAIRENQILQKRYFRDFQSLYDRIKDTIMASGVLDEGVFAPRIAAIYLAWCGLAVQEALDLQKSDVLEDRILVSGREVFPNETIMEYLKEYKCAVGYDTQARYIVFKKYVPSDYLIRTIRKDHLTKKGLSFLLADFSKNRTDESDDPDDEESPAYAYNKIYISGLFHRAYLWECANGVIRKGDMETIRRVFCEDFKLPTDANARLREYHAYRDYFFPAPSAQQ